MLKYWLMKTEPDVFSIEDLQKKGETHWEGVRNYQARNFMRDGMNVGDLVLIYHSNAQPSGIAGIGKVIKAGYPDHFSWNPNSPYFDPKSSPDNPRWFMVDIGFIKIFDTLIPLTSLKAYPELDGMLVTRKGDRLSVQPVSKEHFLFIAELG